MEHEQKQKETIGEAYEKLLEFEPKLVTNFVPENGAEQKKLFLEGAIRNPDHIYTRLSQIDCNEVADEIRSTGSRILSSKELNPKFTKVYEEFIENYLKKTRMMQLAQEYKAIGDLEQKAQVRAEYMALNIELYGEPDETTYRSLLQEKLWHINSRELAGTAAQLRDELFELVTFDTQADIPSRFSPSADTVDWMHDTVDTLYGKMLSHIPDQEQFTVDETKALFEVIISDEFGEAAEGWTVDIEEAKSINVKSAEKRIVIPIDRGDLTRKMLSQLVVHEIGVHMLRSVIGGETDLHPLRNGLTDYYDAEEGLGKVMEQALQGKFVEAGIDHYITAGLSYYDQKDFREIFEVKWRLHALAALNTGSGEISETQIESSRKAAYGGTMRMLRGTDELPWFKDLAYYNGSVDAWRHLESICGDDIKFMFVLMGKANPAMIEHERAQYESHYYKKEEFNEEEDGKI